VESPRDENLRKYIEHFNVYLQDPECMPKPESPYFKSIAQFHLDYLRKLLREKGDWYSKKNVAGVATVPYLQELLKRTNETNHLNSFRDFVETLQNLK
jgi:hypothetical protein